MRGRMLCSLTVVWLFVSAAVSWFCGPVAALGEEESGYTIDALGLYDELHTRNDGYHEGSLQHTTTTGYAAGYSVRWKGDSKAGDSAWIYSSETGVSKRIGLVDPDGAERWSAYPTALNRRGQVVGVAIVTNYSNPRWCWFYDSATEAQTQIGLLDEEYTRDRDGMQNTEVQALTESGHAFGNSHRYNVDDYVGRSVWAFDSNLATTTRIGFFSTGYTHPTNGEQHSEFKLANPQGFAAGWSMHYTDEGSTSVGWSYNPATSEVRRVGLNDPSANVLWPGGRDDILGVTENRMVIGMYTYGDNEAVWVHNDATNVTTRTGLFDAEHSHSTNGRQDTDAGYAEWNSSGQVIGKSRRFPPGGRSGWSAWTFDPSTAVTTRLGFTDSKHTKSDDQHQNSWTTAINESGMVIGGTDRWDGPYSNGRTAWLYDPSAGTTTKIGNLTSLPGTNDYQMNDAWEINNRGQVVGTANQTAGGLGSAMWMYDSASHTTRQLGLTDALHTHPAEKYQESYLTAFTDSGLVGGYSLRLGIPPYGGDSGRSAWLYDYDSATTTPLVFSENADQNAYSIVNYISDSGIVLGKYRLFEGDEDNIILRPFIGNLDFGFFDLESLVADGLAPDGWEGLAEDILYLGEVGGSYSGAFSAMSGDTDLLNWNRFAGMGYRLDGSYVPFATRPVPEPSSFVLLGLGGIGLLTYGWRRRKRAA